MTMEALGRLKQAAGSSMITIAEMTHYHEAFCIAYRLGFFIDAIQLCERIMLEIQQENSNG